MRKHILSAVISVAILAGCQVQWVAQYDEQTDNNVTAYQKKFNLFAEGLIDKSWPECSYENNADSYADLVSDTTLILTRAQSIPLNSHTITQTTALKASIKDIRETHQENDPEEECPSSGYLEQSQNLMNQTIRAILWLEQGKKRKYLKAETEESRSAQPALPANVIPSAGGS